MALALAAAAPALSQKAELVADHRILAPGGELWGELPHFDTKVPLSRERPAAVVREPAYRGFPLYGRVSLGNGAEATTLLVVDHPTNGAWEDCRLYVDSNRNGDLSDDGDGIWGEFPGAVSSAGSEYGPKLVQLRASYGDGNSPGEIHSQPYNVVFTYGRPAPAADLQLSYRRATAFSGVVEIRERRYRTLLVENDNDAVFRPNKGDSGNPLWILLDLDGDGRFSSAERFDARTAFALAGQNYLPRTASWGARYELMPFRGELPASRRAAAQAMEPVKAVPLLPAGTPAPDFTAIRPDGSKLRLADFRGKIVILDFWSTWCVPCIRAMPYLEQLYQQTKDQGVIVLGICVWDSWDNFQNWQREPRVPTTFSKAFDPAAINRDNNNADSIAKRLYNVTGIPTMYVIDREGIVVEGILGYRGESDTRLATALQRAGLQP